MKVSQAIKYLSEYNPDEEIIIAWWDRDITRCLQDENDNDIETPIDVWEFVVHQIGRREHLLEMYSEVITEQIDQEHGRKAQ